MTSCIVTAGQSPGNWEKTYLENKAKISQIKVLPDNQCQSQNKIDSKTNPDKANNGDIISPYLSFSHTQQIIQQLLTYPRMVLLPTQAPKFTALELATKLNITPAQLSSLQKSPVFYKQMAKFINLPLTSLYCSSKLLRSNPQQLPHVQGAYYG